MASHVYLIRNGELYSIGSTDNLDRRLEQLKPGVLVASLKNQNAEKITKELQLSFRQSRIPQSDYYRLSLNQVNECKNRLSKLGGSNYFLPFFSGYRLAIAFILAWIIITFLIVEFGINPVINNFI